MLQNTDNIKTRVLETCPPDLLDVIVGELFENLTEDLVFERLGLQGSFKDLIGELVDRAHSFGRVVAHILHHRYSSVKDIQDSENIKVLQ